MKDSPGKIVKTKNGLTGRTYNNEGLINGKVRVYTGLGKMLCNPKSIKFIGFID